MTTDRADYSLNMAGHPVSTDELFRDVPVQSAEDLACAGVFDTDEELDEFLKHIYAARRIDLA